MKFKAYTLEDITEKIFSGGTPKSRESSYWNGEYNWLSSGETREDFIKITEKYITQLGIENSSTKLAKAKDIVIASAGQGYTRGQTSYLLIDTYINQSVIAIRANEDIINPLYLYYNLSSRYSELRSISDSHSSRGSLTTRLLKELKVKIPKLKEQNKVVDLLFNVDKKIELNKSIITNLEELAQTLFKCWFVDFEFSNEEGKPYQSSGGKMVKSELGMIPEGWSVEKFEKMIKISSGKRPKSKVDIKDANNRIPVIGASKVMGYTEVELFDESIMVIGRVGTHGVVQRLSMPCWPSDNTFVLRSKYEEFMYQILKTIDYKSMNRGSTQPLLTQKDIKNVKVVLPNNNLLTKFEDTLRGFSNEISQLKEENNTLEKLRDTLLPKLLSGEIELPDVMEVTDDVPIS